MDEQINQTKPNLYLSAGEHGAADGSDTALQAGRSQVRFSAVYLEFFIDIIFLAAL